MNTTGKCVWIYSRINSPEDQHCTLKMQEQELIRYAEQEGYTVAGTSSDLSSGLEMNRQGLNCMEAAAASGEFDVLLVKSLSRLGRNTKETIDLVTQLNDLDISVMSASEGEISMGDSSWNILRPTM